MSDVQATAAPVAPARRAWPLPGIALGADYNPEQWPEEVWANDVRLMQEAGVTFATVGVFAWAHLEPAEGRFELDWLDRVLDLLHAGGIAVDLATATASPPPWLPRRHPETLPVDRDGRRLWPGSRQAWCPSSPVFREHALRLVETLATRYGEHPALRMWHVSNELGCHNAHCYCDVSAAAFRRWLERRYGDVEALDAAWGTAFWSQRYGDFEEVWPPRVTTAQPNPTQTLDFARFSSDELLAHHCAERDVLRRLTPDVPVTTNFMVTTHVSGLDYWTWAPEQDVVSQDHYLDGRLDDPRHELAFCADLTRGVAGDGPWFLMEHSTSAVNWQPVNHAKAPGQLVRDALTHVARGADAVGYFQWRASRAGAEKFHSALVPHAGTGTKVWRDVVRLGGVLAAAAEVAGTRVESDVAMLFDWQSWWALDRPSMPTTLVSHPDVARHLHRALWERGVTTRFVGPARTADGADLDAALADVRLVLVPALYLTDAATADALARYVRGGGHAVVTYLSGIADTDDHVHLGGYPGAFTEILGVVTEEFFPLGPSDAVRLDDGSTARVWTEATALHGAQAVRTYADGPVAGAPAVTRHEVGEGVAWYLGTHLDAESLGRILQRAADDAGVRPVAQVRPAAAADDAPGTPAVTGSDDAAGAPAAAGSDDAAGARPAAGPTLPPPGWRAPGTPPAATAPPALPAAPAAATTAAAGERTWAAAGRPDGVPTSSPGTGVRPRVRPVPAWARGGSGPVEVVRRSGPNGSYLFVLNHSAIAVEVPATGDDLVTGQYAAGVVRVPAGGCAVVRERRTDDG